MHLQKLRQDYCHLREEMKAKVCARRKEGRVTQPVRVRSPAQASTGISPVAKRPVLHRPHQVRRELQFSDESLFNYQQQSGSMPPTPPPTSFLTDRATQSQTSPSFQPYVPLFSPAPPTTSSLLTCVQPEATQLQAVSGFQSHVPILPRLQHGSSDY